MNLYATEIEAIDPVTGELTIYAGPLVPGISHKDAERYCQNNSIGYCKVIGRHLAEGNSHAKALKTAVTNENTRLN